MPEVEGCYHLDAAAQARLSGGLGRDDQRLDLGPACGLRHRKRAADGPQAPVEAELGSGGDASHALDGRLARHRQDGKGDREIEPRPLLALLRRCQVDRKARAWEPELGGCDAAPHALARLLDSPVCQADDDEAGHAVDQVCLDLDSPGRDPHEPEGERPRNHTTERTHRIATALRRAVTIPARSNSEGRRDVGDAKAVDRDHVEPQPLGARMGGEQHLARLGEPAHLVWIDRLRRRHLGCEFGGPSPRTR